MLVARQSEWLYRTHLYRTNVTQILLGDEMFFRRKTIFDGQLCPSRKFQYFLFSNCNFIPLCLSQKSFSSDKTYHQILLTNFLLGDEIFLPQKFLSNKDMSNTVIHLENGFNKNFISDTITGTVSKRGHN